MGIVLKDILGGFCPQAHLNQVIRHTDLQERRAMVARGEKESYIVVAGEYSFSSMADNGPDLDKFPSLDSALAAILAAGYVVTKEEVGGYGQKVISLEHVATQKEKANWEKKSDEKWSAAKKCFVRFGTLPEDGRSINHADGTAEDGVSVYNGEILPSGEARPTIRTNQELGSLLMGLISRKMYIVEGDEIGVGSDGEPVLKNCRIVKMATR